MKNKNTTIQYARALYEVTKDLKGEKMHAAVSEFVKILARNHKLKQVDRIVEVFVKYAKKMQGIIPITVSTARTISDKELIKIGNVFSHQAEVTPVIDPSIIGGFVAATDEVVFDASIKKQLEKLKIKMYN